MQNVEFLDFYSPSAGFEQPLVLVDACHERVRRMVELLVRLIEHLHEHGADERAAISARSILEYFKEAWPRHFKDEELDLFPRVRLRLRDRHSAESGQIIDAIETLTEQHRDFYPLWRRIEPSLQAVAGRSTQRLDESAVHAFVELYRVHLALEEDVLAPVYTRLFTAEDLRQIGTSMAARRGVTWPGPSPKGPA